VKATESSITALASIMQKIACAVGLLLAACGNDRAVRTPMIDASSPDVRPLGGVDGTCSGDPGRPRVLVYTYENQWRHLSNYYARQALFEMCTTRGFQVTSSNDPHVFNAAQLAQFDVVVFAVTSGSGIDRLGKEDFEAWVRAGGGVVGFEAATATEQGWQFYVQNLGAEFAAHPPQLEPGTIRFAPVSHPITDGLASFKVVEQWYVFRSRPEHVPGLQVLMTLDEDTLPASHPAELKLGYHAYGWAHERFGGRVFYTALGDNPAVFAHPTVLELAGRAIEWAAHRR
jgi:type 1 glutamine amidotransferase